MAAAEVSKVFCRCQRPRHTEPEAPQEEGDPRFDGVRDDPASETVSSGNPDELIQESEDSSDQREREDRAVVVDRAILS